jgi:hypothetical protein
MGTLSLQTATRYKEPEPNSESSSDDELFLKSEIRPGLRRAAAPPLRSCIIMRDMFEFMHETFMNDAPFQQGVG